MSLNCLYNLIKIIWAVLGFLRTIPPCCITNITLKGGNHMSNFDREKLIELENEFYEKFSEELDYQDEILRFYSM